MEEDAWHFTPTKSHYQDRPLRTIEILVVQMWYHKDEYYCTEESMSRSSPRSPSRKLLRGTYPVPGTRVP
eukprot:798829-Rhodomonas_salina.3